ncbi:cytochrome P450 alkane hydroxylase [Apiospora saccharicola]|uniref:Cytochrome P450 alkane hydroxylase n=1 Tax=Apiospora saccharicola TaxID=335842 RepID=A0ABR1W3G7_9PEZI
MANIYLLAAAGAFVLYLLARQFRVWLRERSFSNANGCQPAPMDKLITWLDPLGIGILFKLERHLTNHTLLEYMKSRFEENGYTFKSRVLLDDFYWTCEPKNIQAILATQFQSFGVGIDRYNNFKPLMGHGIFTSDGAKWEQARALVRPNFVRDQVADLESFEVHFQNMLARIPEDGKTPVNLKEIFQCMTLDSASEMLFGESLNTLTNNDSQVASAQFAAAFKVSQSELARRCRLGRLADWNISKEFLDACEVTQRFVDDYVAKAMQMREKQMQPGYDKAGKGGRYVFLEELAMVVDDPIAVRDHLLNVLIPARDSTSTLLAATFFAVAKDPNVLQKLRDEVVDLNGVHPSFETLKNMKYLKWVMNETLRLWPIVPLNGRQANRDVTLPVGGGPDGQSPIFVKKGQNIGFSTYAMHRRKDIWGPDADQFIPERWEDKRPGWEYLPFNGGPRICIGQQLALTEAGYTIVRLLQCFREIESLDHSEWREGLALACSIDQPVTVRMVPW